MTFEPRFTKPEAGNKYYITIVNGGWSRAIVQELAKRME